MDKYAPISRASGDSLDATDEESATFLPARLQSSSRYPFLETLKRIHTLLLYSIIALLAVLLVGSQWKRSHCEDPSIGIWSPAQNEVIYKTVEFGKYFDMDNRSPYTQTPSKELDAMWEDLYNFGISGITPDEASKLYEPTVHLPHDNSTYVVSLGVFHQLHCVNNLRKALYPDEYPGLWEYNEDGTVKHDTILALHWDHCIDILRQTLMCHADITPVPFYYREKDDNVFSVLASSHTCRDFNRIADWAKTRQLKGGALNQ